MTTKKSRKARASISEPTVRLRPISEELPKRAFAEEGLSIDPEDMGARFLADATEQHNFESLRPAETAEVWLGSAPPSDEAMMGPHIDVDELAWTSTVEQTLEAGSGEPPSLDAATGDEDDAPEEEDGIDLVEGTIREESLLDEEGDEPGETKASHMWTDDMTPRRKPNRSL